MINRLSSTEAQAIYNNLKPYATDVLFFTDNHLFDDAINKSDELKGELKNAETFSENKNENYLNDLFVLNEFSVFITTYVKVWKHILESKFSTSWGELQDALDLIRCIKKFTNIDLSFFEEQLLALEELYPYSVFFSIGATAEYFQCSICGEDIDSFECPHVKGELYAGTMAIAVAKNMTQLDHVAMVLEPEDKRCVVQYEDDGEQFHAIRYLSDLIVKRKMKISEFRELEFSKKRKRNPSFKKQSRNEICECGSGKKFKKCCINEEYIDGEHVEIIAKPYNIEHAIV